MEISGPDTKAERILVIEEPGHTILGEIGSTAAAVGISSPGLRIRVWLSSEQFEAEEAGWTRPRFRVLVSSQLVTWRLYWTPIGQLRPLMTGCHSLDLEQQSPLYEALASTCCKYKLNTLLYK